MHESRWILACPHGTNLILYSGTGRFFHNFNSSHSRLDILPTFPTSRNLSTHAKQIIPAAAFPLRLPDGPHLPLLQKYHWPSSTTPAIHTPIRCATMPRVYKKREYHNGPPRRSTRRLSKRQGNSAISEEDSDYGKTIPPTKSILKLTHGASTETKCPCPQFPATTRMVRPGGQREFPETLYPRPRARPLVRPGTQQPLAGTSGGKLPQSRWKIPPPWSDGNVLQGFVAPVGNQHQPPS